MSTPIKPWESSGTNLRSERNGTSLSVQSSSRIPDVNVRANPAIPPPLPPRPSNINLRRPVNSTVPQVYRSYPTAGSYYGSYNSYGGAYNSYGGAYNSYGNYGLYNGMGYGGGQYPGYPFNANDPNNRLIALAEETSRPAFESIEHVVRAFGSVSFMLESTLGALHGSFRAALGVAEHLGQLRHILSAVSIFKFLQWIIRRVKVFFGAKGADGSLGNIWGEATKAVETPPLNDRSSSPVPSHWLLGAFLGFVMSGSYLAWRLVSHLVGPGNDGRLSPFRGEEMELWVQAKDPNCVFAIACHDFTATSDQELSFRAGQKLIIAPKSRQPCDAKDWLLACFLWTPRQGGEPKIGLIPENYIQVVDRRNIRGNGAYPQANYSYSPYGSYPQSYTQQPLLNPQQPLQYSQQPQTVYPPSEYPINVEPNLHTSNRVPSKVQLTSAPSKVNEPNTEIQPTFSASKADKVNVPEGLKSASSDASLTSVPIKQKEPKTEGQPINFGESRFNNISATEEKNNAPNITQKNSVTLQPNELKTEVQSYISGEMNASEGLPQCHIGDINVNQSEGNS